MEKIKETTEMLTRLIRTKCLWCGNPLDNRNNDRQIVNFCCKEHKKLYKKTDRKNKKGE